MFLLVVQFMMQKLNLISIICHSLAACQRHTASSLVAVIGLSNNDVACVAWMETRL